MKWIKLIWYSVLKKRSKLPPDWKDAGYGKFANVKEETLQRWKNERIERLKGSQ